jgi:glycerol transport system ATP-binding protein
VLRSQLKRLHKQFGFTMVYVTHDQTEALTFADKVVVMYEGQIVQIGTPAELFETPRHTFVGYFIGSPGMNVIPAKLDGSSVTLGNQRLDIASAPTAAQGDRIELGIRPEFIRLGREGMPVTIRRIEDIGRRKIVRADFEGQPIAIVADEDAEIPAEARVRFEPQGINIYANSWRIGGEA